MTLVAETSMIFRLENLTAAQGGKEVLNVPHFELAKGKVMAVVGPNGSGKTTLLLCLAGLLETTGGKLFFRGQEILDNSWRAELRRHTSLAFQDPLLFNTTVKGNIESGLRLRGISKANRQQRVKDTAQLLSIADLLGRSACKLSGGESQRVSLARAIALQPDVLLLDEPFSALDAPTKLSLLNDLGRILEKTDTTAVFSTHDLTDALYLADSVAVLNGGQLVQCGTVREIMCSLEDPFVVELVASLKATAGYIMKNAELGNCPQQMTKAIETDML